MIFLNTSRTRVSTLHNFRNRIANDVNVSDPEVHPAALDWLDGEIAALEQSKNARLAGRTLGLRTWLKSLVLLILSPSTEESKGERV
jgi:hypothetical protein